MEKCKVKQRKYFYQISNRIFLPSIIMTLTFQLLPITNFDYMELNDVTDSFSYIYYILS